MSLSISPLYQRALTALGFKDAVAAGVQLSEVDQKRLILWLEETKIRLLSSAEREGLRQTASQNHEEWLKSFNAYLRALGVIPNPPPGTAATGAVISELWSSPESRLSIIQKLISLAAEDVYLDLKEGGLIDLSKAVEVQGSGLDSAEPVLLSDCVNNVNALLEKFKLPLLPKQVPELTLQKLASAIEAVEAFVAPVECNQTHQPNLNMPVGFNVEGADAQLKNFCSVLRLVHVAEIRKLQQHVNETLSALQEVTGDPKTDSKKGRVGR